MNPLLSITDLHVSYGAVPAVAGVDLELNLGEVRVILGANGAGKTTIIKSILGLVKAQEGSIRFRGERELRVMRTHQIHDLGISWVPEGRQLWGTLTVRENLRMGAYSERDEDKVGQRIEAMLKRFPRLREREDQLAGSLSGGEQQMVAVARALISEPQIILMDEPSLGLAPMVVQSVFDLVREINDGGISILMVEQNARQALKVANWVYLLEIGRVVEQGPTTTIAANKRVQEIFLGGRA